MSPPFNDSKPTVLPIASSDSDSGDDQDFSARVPAVSEKRLAQNAKFSAWLSHRAEKITKDEVQAIIENADEETLSIRSLMAKQESNVIISTPREYQLELFERAKKQNIIAVLDTGSGKTLIAVLLLKHIIDQELEHRAMGKKPRVSFFLVDCVTLVFQQFAVLECNLDQNIERFCGEMGCELWVKETWRKVFADNMVIVCTAEILNQCLMHSFISMDEINLLIFDEAHHTKGDHPYARIMKDYYMSRDDPSKLPKIFGLTASPVDARVDVVKAAKELEAMLHCQIATTSDLTLLRNSISRPDEHIALYDRLEYAYETALCSRLKTEFGDLKALSRNFKNAKQAASLLGEWCADSLWRFALENEESIRKAERKLERLFHREEDQPTELLDKELRRLSEAQEVVKNWKFAPPTFEGNSLSPKVALLHMYLKQIFEKPTDSKCIIFVKQRYTARVLGQVLGQLGTPYMHLDLLMGSRPGEIGDVKFSFRQQIMTLLEFRKGELNCLIATSIAEEGLDIPDCSLVIRFDLYDTLIQYIQSRGRARHVNSKYIHMVEKGNKMHYQAVKDVRLGEEVMRQFCQALPADRLLQGEDYDLGTALMKEKLYRKYVDPKTGATLTYANSLVVLAHFVGCLPHNSETIQQTTYILSTKNKEFTCEVILPENSPIQSATGKPCSRKSLAKRSAAFEACLVLREKHFLDSNLIPIYHKYLPQMRNAHLALHSKKTNAYKRKTKPDLWEQSRGLPPRRLFMTVIELEKPGNLAKECRPIALLTRTQLPNIPAFLLHLSIGKTSNVLFKSMSPDFDVDPSRLSGLTIFTMGIYKDIFAKEFEINEARMDYWLAPVFGDWRARTLQTPDCLVDWGLINYVGSNPRIRWSRDTPEDQLINRYIVDTWFGGRRFYSLAIEPGLKPSDPIPTIEATGKYSKEKNILSYSHASMNHKRRLEAVWEENQPVIRAEEVAHRRDFLDEHGEQDKAFGTQRHICPEPFRISALPVSVVSMCYLFPAIIHRLEAYLIAKEAFNLLGLDVRLDLALEALTKDSDNTEEHRAEQIQVQRGMGKNYERLEFYGDCFLKLATSITLFCNSPEENEFEYHVRRMLMICNSNLLKSALNVKLYEYVRSKAFDRRVWYPEGIELLKGRGATKKNKGEDGDGKVRGPQHQLGDKTVADVCEAMIGAALLSDYDIGNKDMAVRAVTALVSSEDHNVLKWADYYTLYEKPRYLMAQATASQLNLAMQVEKKDDYRFIHPRLLRSAFIHPSCSFATERIPCLQRLEFLGDALLDLACIDYLFHRYPDKDPQWLTEHKMAMVSNKFLAALSVKLGFHKHLRSSGAVIEYQNREYVAEVEEAERDAKGARDYWTNTKQPPKALSDIVEAYIGAIFVDSEFNFKQVERFFDQHVRWFFEDMAIYDTFANNHPTTYLHNLMTLSFGCTNYRLMASEIPSIIPGGPVTSIAALMIHDEIMAEGQASSTKNAKVKASSSALKKLSGLAPFEYRMQYHCDCEGQTKAWVGEGGDGVGMVGTAI